MPRKKLSLTEKLAGALLRIKNPDGSWLVPEPLRSTGTAQEVYKAVQFDHAVLDAFEDDKAWSNRPQNIYPMLTDAHRAKSIVDNRNAKKVARIRRKADERQRERDEAAAKARREILRPEPRRDLENYSVSLRHMHGPYKGKSKPKYNWDKRRYERPE